MELTDLLVRMATAPGDSDLVRLLAKAQIGKRMAQIAALLQQQDSSHLTLLARTQSSAPQQFRRLLSDPGIVTGARRDIGPLIVAAVILGGAQARVDVHVIDGEVLLPTLGRLRLPRRRSVNRPERVTISVAEGRVSVEYRPDAEALVLPDDLTSATSSWQPLERITAGRKAVLDVVLTTTGPLPGIYGVPADFHPQSIVEWRAAITAGWELLEKERPEHAAAIAAGLVAIVPVPAAPNGDTTSCTIDGTFGTIFMSLPPDPETVAVTLIHEFQHGKLSAAMDLGTLCSVDQNQAHYAPWRDDPRPSGALLQGVYAHLGVAQFWNTHRTAAPKRALLAHVEFARWRDETWIACQEILDDAAFTEAGRVFVRALATELDLLRAEPIPAEAAELADLIGLTHTISWRLRNLDMEPHAANTTAAAWLARQPAPLRPLARLAEPVANTRTVSDAQTRLLYGRVAGVRTPKSPSTADSFPAAIDYGHARMDYTARLRRNPNDLDAWAGLALSVPAADPAHRSLRSVPEIVAATYRQVVQLGSTTPDPIDIARWLAEAISN
ncbi:aKG-HExxH-type peptide beta-hydroxylase [Nocardia sp. NBC_01388]|uniref:aKG-HExxH-type peptide beta-hydroxylase n=1 Tax=Nocardia sp. NBC_01388 TaxID=2903596 RepID=UPI003251A24D